MARAAQLAALHQAIQDNSLPAVKQLLEDDPDLSSQANVRDENAGIFTLQTHAHVYYIYMHIYTYLHFICIYICIPCLYANICIQIM